ncbi:T9SS type B sorting domain-containing protein [Lutibacter sp. B1]|uniref:T9SS type B sorting domain-containing protein n=1 Tax=Lutibacter sp. B1 TaxID=2725996 RepID=UPI0014570B9A|nr:T9SS type B sorting domain-containing protein [Lutibacter sp. B1]NLP56588.1 T9SS type B sorting domain-containing protein [Lutibacter sp. B1]
MKKLFFLLLILFPSILFSQKEAAIWYFGQYAGLDFNSGVPVPIYNGELYTYEGCATISDYQGNLLFYTDGVTVWDRNHNIMPNGTNLLGDASSTQSAIIVPRPNNINQYYIFTVDARGNSPLSANGINYSTVDLTLNGGLGDIISNEKNINLVSRAYEKITAVKHADNNSYWVITFITDQFLAWRVNATGIDTNPIVSNNNISRANDSRGYLKISPDGTKIACANFGVQQNLMIYDFNNATGIVSNEIELDFDESDDNPYGVEFSNQSQKLYVTTSKLDNEIHSPPGRLYQFDMLSANIQNSRVLIHETSVNTRGALQLAIDGKIYRALSVIEEDPGGTNYLGIINNPETDGLACNYTHNALDISNGELNRKVFEGLPPFIQSFFLTSISANDVCFGNETEFTVSSSVQPTTIAWDFGDPSTGINNTSTELNPTHIFSSPGIFTVTAIVTIGTETSTLTLNVTIYNEPIVNSPVTLVQCDDDLDGIVDFNLEEANTLISEEDPLPTITYFTTETAAIDNTNSISNPTTFSNETISTVWARVENTSDCFAIAEVILEVVYNEIPEGLILTFEECDDLVDNDDSDGIATFDFSSVTTQILDALAPETNFIITYYENIEDALAEQNNITPSNYRNTSSPNTQQIVVRVDDLDNNCFGLEYITLIVNPVPKFDLLELIEFCSNSTDLSFGIENPIGIYNYIWRNEEGTEIAYTPDITVDSSGLYSVTAIDTTNTCEKVKSIQVTINNAPVVTTPVTHTECDDDTDGYFDFNLENANSIISNETPTPTITYFLNETAAINNSTTDAIANPTVFSNETSSTVWARVENDSNCFVTAQINLEVISIEIPSDLMLIFNECDNIYDNDETNGITTFNFSDATNEILNILLPKTNLAVTYYENINDATNEVNSINPSNYRNTSSPNTQQIVVRVDDLTNTCYGLGYHITLNVNPVPQFDLLNTVSLCLSSSNTNIGVENPSDDFNYIWFDEFNNEIGYTQSISVYSDGEYSVTATNEFNCTKTKSIIVNSNEVTELLGFNISNVIITDNSSNNTITVVTNNLPNSVYEYAIDDGEYQSNNLFENVPAGIHTVRIIDIENCSESSVEVSLIGIPNFFTPNFDGYNDTWHVTGIEFQPNSNVYIFDRFGKLIAVLDPLGPGWNGLYKGNPLPSTDYWYKVELDDGRVLKGHFSLIRR